MMNASQKAEFYEFIQELNDSINDLCIDCHDYYEDEVYSAYDSDEIDEPDTDELGECEYKYLTKLGAVSACKRSLKKMLRIAKKSFKITIKDAISEIKEYFCEELDDYVEYISDFIEDFSDSFDTYEFEDTSLTDKIIPQRKKYFDDLLSDSIINKMKAELSHCISEVLDSYNPELPEDLFSVDSLMNECEFDFDEDDKRYDFELSDACDTVTDALNNRIETIAEELFDEINKRSFEIVSDYTDNLKERLCNLYFENFDDERLSEVEIEHFKAECLIPPEYDDDTDNFIDIFSDQPTSWIVYPWELKN